MVHIFYVRTLVYSATIDNFIFLKLILSQLTLDKKRFYEEKILHSFFVILRKKLYWKIKKQCTF